jgi:hypothetical protein
MPAALLTEVYYPRILGVFVGPPLERDGQSLEPEPVAIVQVVHGCCAIFCNDLFQYTTHLPVSR